MSHFYDAEGKSQFTIIGANGKERPTTIRDAKKFGWEKSVTTYLSLIAQPGLEIWKRDQLLEAVLASGLGLAESSINQWKGMVIQKSEKIGKDTAKRGSEIHNQLEAYYKQELESVSLSETSIQVIKLIQENFPNKTWIAEESFSLPGEYGGTIDLYSSDFSVLLDFKTKDKKAFDKKMAYPSHAMQLAAYKEAIKYKHLRRDAKLNMICANVFICRDDETVEPVLEIWSEEDILRYGKAFQCLVDYDKYINNTGYIG